MSPDFVYNWYALARENAITNLIDPRTSVEGIRDYLDEAGSKYILNTNLFTPKIVKAVERGENFRVINYSLGNYAKKIEDPSLAVATGLMTLASKRAAKNDYRFSNAPETHEKVQLEDRKSIYRENQPLTIVHTGGTTGIPKGVVLSHDNYNAMAYEYKKSSVEFDPNDRFLLIMPPWISYGSGMLHMSLITGMTSVIVSKLNSKKMDKLILKKEPQWFAGVPAHIQIVSNSKNFQNADKKFLKGGAVGGGAISPQLYKSASKQFRVDPGYALTEVTSAFAVKQPGGVFKPDSVGFPLPGCTMGIFERDEKNEETLDKELGYNQFGEICVRTPNMMLGYFKDEENTNVVLKKHSDGNIWVHTGDYGYIDEDGLLYITDRLKERITRYDGFKVYPSQIEKVINSCKGVESCKVVGVDDIVHESGQVPKAFIVLKPEAMKNGFAAKNTLNTIKTRCKKALPEYYTEGLEFEQMKSLPLTNLGKVDFKKLAEMDKEKKNQNKELIKKIK